VAVPDRAKEATTQFLKAQFHRYYDATKPTLPDRFGRREFGFMFWTAGIVQRHIGFSKEEELKTFLTSRIPAHTYYSSAYYEKPGAPTMEEKGWLGADLIFDLDADHLPGSKAMSYPEMLEAVREGIVRLWDRFLAAKLGIPENKMRLVFSGGRGYHIHVFDERLLSLGSHERREIVDFISAKGLDPTWIFKESAFDKKEFQGRVRVKTRVVGPARDSPGWAGILARGLVDLTKRLEELGPETSIEFLASLPGIEKEAAISLYKHLFEARVTKPRIIRAVDRVRDGQIEALNDKDRDSLIRVAIALEQIPLSPDQDEPLADIREKVAMRQRGETDEPVTSDIKRLIRMPSSLHGKTGLQVVPMSRDEIDEFRPLRDAVPRAWTDGSVRMNLKNKISMEIRGEAFNLAPGVNDVPQYLAIFLAARGLATVVPEA